MHISGFDLPRDSVYTPAVTRVFERFPGLQLQVHELVTSGERLAMRFSEHGAAGDADGRLAAWGGIGMYRWNGRRGSSRTSSSRTRRAAAAADDRSDCSARGAAPRSLDDDSVRAAEPRRGADRARLAGEGELRAAPNAVIDGSWYEPWESLLRDEEVSVNDLFSAGDHVAFHVTQRGSCAEGALALRCVGLARVAGGEVRAVRAITDRLGARTALARA